MVFHSAENELLEATDREQDNARSFQELLIRNYRTGPTEINVETQGMFPEPDPVQSAKNRFKSYGEQDVFYLEKPFYQPEHQTNMAFQPRITRGGKRSYHGVIFGDLLIGSNQTVPVAVKPHKDDNAIDSCLSEYFNNEAVRQLGFHNLDPVGFIVRSEDEAYTLTVMDDSISTLDTIDWSNFYPDISTDPGMQDIWRQISYQTAVLHAHGNMSHGDLAARNITTTIEGGVFMIDWEKARINLTSPRDAEVRYNHSYSDLSVLLKSMCRPAHSSFKAGVGLFYGKSMDWWDGFEEIFFDIYKQTRYDIAINGNHSKQTVLDVKEEIVALEDNLRNDMQMMRDICDSIESRGA